jgi:hypothetical protein
MLPVIVLMLNVSIPAAPFQIAVQFLTAPAVTNYPVAAIECHKHVFDCLAATLVKKGPSTTHHSDAAVWNGDVRLHRIYAVSAARPWAQGSKSR